MFHFIVKPRPSKYVGRDTPGHAVDHVAFLTEDNVCFAGDLVLGLGSTIVGPDGGGLAAYMESLRLLRAEPLRLLCPGHGPWVTDPAAKLDEHHRHQHDPRHTVQQEVRNRGARVRGIAEQGEVDEGMAGPPLRDDEPDTDHCGDRGEAQREWVGPPDGTALGGEDL